ncbi:hypothetical protein A8E86_17390 [Burkholderia cenocepacia]|nr:hypothetical protein A8E74_09790 [Burkholderia cenocepacia]ONV40576.1 hypothetical protein A8E82_19660 [Burkholderia cenocepacia]ONV60150.1 hypothetical protein A8E76_14165 [Burkholderia cenocepacia]ONV80594.1 hypothetical protein A8E84_20580 [Burkholderia cenocepacia]ONV84890.1 hypothetical protein A8E84_12260 [Burkholderia cenocepacia]
MNGVIVVVCYSQIYFAELVVVGNALCYIENIWNVLIVDKKLGQLIMDMSWQFFFNQAFNFFNEKLGKFMLIFH